MSKPERGLPWLYLALDLLGAVLLVVGILALTGIDFGQAVLRTVAPGFIALGVILMIPMVVWAVGRGRS